VTPSAEPALAIIALLKQRKETTLEGNKEYFDVLGWDGDRFFRSRGESNGCQETSRDYLNDGEVLTVIRDFYEHRARERLSDEVILERLRRYRFF